MEIKEGGREERRGEGRDEGILKSAYNKEINKHYIV